MTAIELLELSMQDVVVFLPTAVVDGVDFTQAKVVGFQFKDRLLRCLQLVLQPSRSSQFVFQSIERTLGL